LSIFSTSENQRRSGSNTFIVEPFVALKVEPVTGAPT